MNVYTQINCSTLNIHDKIYCRNLSTYEKIWNKNIAILAMVSKLLSPSNIQLELLSNNLSDQEAWLWTFSFQSSSMCFLENDQNAVFYGGTDTTKIHRLICWYILSSSEWFLWVIRYGSKSRFSIVTQHYEKHISWFLRMLHEIEWHKLKI